MSVRTKRLPAHSARPVPTLKPLLNRPISGGVGPVCQVLQRKSPAGNSRQIGASTFSDVPVRRRVEIVVHRFTGGASQLSASPQVPCRFPIFQVSSCFCPSNTTNSSSTLWQHETETGPVITSGTVVRGAIASGPIKAKKWWHSTPSMHWVRLNPRRRCRARHVPSAKEGVRLSRRSDPSRSTSPMGFSVPRPWI
jgi:hypothetical protein